MRNKTVLSKHGGIWALFLMLMTFSISLLLIDMLDSSLWLIMSISFSLVLLFGLWGAMNVSSRSIISVFTIYIFGFALFLGGSFLHFALLGGETVSTRLFTFNFGIHYSLQEYEQISLYTQLCITLIVTFWGYYWGARVRPINQKTYRFAFNHRLHAYLYWGTLVLAIIELYGTIRRVIQVASLGYMSLYIGVSSGEARLTLLVGKLFDIMICLIMSTRTNDAKNKYVYRIILIIYIISGLFSVLTGTRGSFITTVLFILWLNREKFQFNIKSIWVFIVCFSGLILLTNLLTTSSRYTSNEGTIISAIADSLGDQGFTLMLYDLSTKFEYWQYPLHAKIKTFLPGWQLFVPIIDPAVKQYELSFDAFLIQKVAPETYYSGYGYGWSLLSDFYIFSFGSLMLFYLFNFLFGYLIGKIEVNAEKSTFLKGLEILLVLSVFTLSRSSLSVLTATVLLYLVAFLLINKIYKRHANSSYY